MEIGVLSRSTWMRLFIFCAFFIGTQTSLAQVGVRVQFNFILNNIGGRPPAGNINTDADIDDQVERANDILSSHISELRIQNLGITDVSDISQYYTAHADDATRDALRSDALADKSVYNWRDDAVNIYITAGTGSAVAKFPPDNDIILVNQGAHDDTVAHELGHILKLLHTHQAGHPNQDECADTIQDDSTWNRDDISFNNFGCYYVACTASQQAQVDLVWFNLMSYHNTNNRSLLSDCQMDRESTQSYSDRSWLLSGLPVYVDSGYSGSTPSGAFTTPYKLIQQAIDGGLSDKVVVLQEGTHTRPTSTIDVPTVMVPRMGPAIVQDSPPDYELPYALDLSDNLAVRNAAIKAQRRAMEDDIAGVIAALQEAEESATGREKLTIQLELAQRYMEIKQFDKSESYYQKVYDNTEQVGLRKKAVRMIQIVREKKQAAGKKHKDKE